MAFELPPLPYGYDALEPVISRETMTVHHDKHHAAYTAKINEGVAADPELQDKTIEEILAVVSTQPPLVRNNGGGFWNHDFFWRIMAPKGASAPSGGLAAAIEAYGGLDKLKEDFNTKGAGQFGSGWAWVIKDASGSLKVTSTPNQDNPLMDDVADRGVPILGNDVWEHAYYLTYQNDRPGYLKAWWDVVNWDEAGRRYDAD
ncbi:superoxide dismutase, Fe-Mn family [Sphingomonas palmae]|uniref:Superoxide dismutase n=1 Tax=Sphingomonas palmae TaxID=1855283 RepID=A0A1H7T684_9SPHN|nr:superoxide dismutase [Sphingomonas palmae]SEL79834.1 superoxide dismutase, Fe-Mn family [Sphingomonas palmae]